MNATRIDAVAKRIGDKARASRERAAARARRAVQMIAALRAVEAAFDLRDLKTKEQRTAIARVRALFAGVILLALCACGPAFTPAYEGEPDCGRRDALHAIRGAACDGSIRVACECDDRSTLECVAGVWEFSHDFCRPGLQVIAQQDGGAP